MKTNPSPTIQKIIKEFDVLTDWMDSGHGPLKEDRDKIKSWLTDKLQEVERESYENGWRDKMESLEPRK